MYRSPIEALAFAKKQLQLGPRARRDDMYDALLSLIPAAEKWKKESAEAAPIMDTIQMMIRRELDERLDER